MPVTEPSITSPNQAPVSLAGGRRRVAACIFTFASDAQGTYALPIILPKGARVWDARFNLSASGRRHGDPGLRHQRQHRQITAARRLTTTDSWVSVGLNAAMGVELAAAEQIIMTVGAAALPASGRMVVMFVSSID